MDRNPNFCTKPFVLSSILVLLLVPDLFSQPRFKLTSPNRTSIEHSVASVAFMKASLDMHVSPTVSLGLVAVGKELLIDSFLSGSHFDFLDAFFLFFPGLLVAGDNERVTFIPAIDFAYSTNKRRIGTEFSIMQVWFSPQLFVNNEFSWNMDSQFYWGISSNYRFWGNFYLGLGLNVTRIITQGGFVHGRAVVDPKMMLGFMLTRSSIF